jgi:SnoaL-like domain
MLQLYASKTDANLAVSQAEVPREPKSTPGRMSSFSHWQHMLSLPLVTIQGDTATARTDFFSTHRGRPERGLNVHYNSPGAFYDQLVRTPKGWRIRFRRLEVYFGDALQIASPTQM